MKKLIYILTIIMIATVVYGQTGVASYGSGIVRIAGGGAVKITPDMISGYLTPDPDEESLSQDTSGFDVVYFQDIEDMSLAAEYTEDSMLAQWTQGNWIADNFTAGLGDTTNRNVLLHDTILQHLNASIVDIPALSDGSGGATRAVRILNEAGKYGLQGSDCGGDGFGLGTGASWSIDYNGTGWSELELSVAIMHPAGADSRLESKNPALRGDFSWGGDTNEDGFRGMSITRSNWEQSWLFYMPSYSANRSNPGDAPYEYTLEMWTDPDNPGVDDWAFDFTDSTWYVITYHIVKNSDGNADGWIAAAVNGRVVSVVDNIEMFTDDGYIDELEVIHHHGGCGESYGPSTDQYIHYDNFIISANTRSKPTEGDTWTVLGWDNTEQRKVDVFNDD